MTHPSFDDRVNDELEFSQVEVDGFRSVRPEGKSNGVGSVVVEDSFGDGEDEL